MSLLTALIVKNSHILAGIYFIFLKKRPKPNFFNTKLGPQNLSYQIRQVLVLFCKLVALILSQNCVKDLSFTRIC